MSWSIDLYWSFRSPYSYLTTERLVRLASEHGLEIRVRPVYPLAIRNPEFFEDVNPLWRSYLRRDVPRVADYYGIDFGWPRPDPIVQDLETNRISEDQPYIYRLVRLGAEAALQGRGLPFIDEVSKIIWDGRVEGWNEGTHLAEAASRAGLDLTAMDRAIAADFDKYDRYIEQNQKALEAAGHWGVPTMVFEDEPFFGQDRIELLVWRMKQRGLHKRD